MKIAMISEHANPLVAMGGVDTGGQNVHVAELSKALTRRGHDVTVYTRRDAVEQRRSTLAPDGYHVVHVPAGPAGTIAKDELLPHMPAFAEFVRRAVQERPPDVLHSHFWMSGLVATEVSRSAHIPVVHTFHALGVVKRRNQGRADTSPPERIGIERRVGQTVARVAATCSDEVFELIRMGVPRSRIQVVPCGVDVTVFSPFGHALPKKRPRLVTVGRLVPRKGFDTVIKALANLSDVELVIAGGPQRGAVADDPEGRRLLALAERLGVADRVSMPGQVPRDQMPALLRSADAVVCTPWYEPFGIVPLEAMACGRPVIAAAVGGLTDTVVDGVTGLHVRPRSPSGLAHAVASALDDPDLLASFGRAGYARARTRYSWHRIAADTERIYEGAIDVGSQGLGEVAQ